jgi:hypothetical protein
MRKKKRRPAQKKGPVLGMLRGAKPLAGFIFGDEDKFKNVYPLKNKLGLFYLNGRICGLPEHIATRIAELEAAAAGGDAA